MYVSVEGIENIEKYISEQHDKILEKIKDKLTTNKVDDSKPLKTLNDIEDSKIKEWMIKAISSTDEFKQFTENLDISQFLSKQREENDNMNRIKAKVNLGEPIDLDDIVLVPLKANGKTFKLIKLIKNENGKLEGIDFIRVDKLEDKKEQLVKGKVSDVIINLNGKEEIINTVSSQVLDVSPNRTLFAVEFYGEYDVVNRIVENANKNNFVEFKVTKKDSYSNTDCQFAKEDKEELGNMRLVKYYSHKRGIDFEHNAKHIVVFGKSAEWYTAKEDEVGYLIDELKQ